MSNKKFAAIWGSILAVILAVVVVANILCSTLFYGVLTTFFDGGEKVVQGGGEIYYHPTAADHDTAVKNSQELIKAIQGEGAILLKNDGFLPMAGTEQVTLLGRDSVDFMYGGGGSGSLSSKVTRATMREALEADGFSVNPVMWDLLSGLTEKYPRGTSGVGQLLSVGEIPVSEYTADVRASYAQYSDAAIVVIGRSGSEGTDLELGGNGQPHALELGQDEIRMLEEACGNFDNVVVILNTSATLELGFLDEYPQIRAALYVGYRWYETADAEGFWSSQYAMDTWGVSSYEDVVQFPFGYGLSYDYKAEGAYVLSAGEYTLSLRTDAHTVKETEDAQHTFALAEKLVFGAGNGRANDLQPAVNLFDDVSSHTENYLSRADFTGTMPTAPTAEDMTASSEIINGVKVFVYDTYANAAMPATEAEGDTALVDLAGKDYDDPLWDALLDRLAPTQMDNLLSIGGYKTVGVSTIGKAPTLHEKPLKAAILAAINSAMSRRAALDQEFRELFASSKADGGYLKHADAFKRITENMAALKEKKALILTQQEGNSAANRRIQDAVNIINDGAAEITEWEEGTIRQLVDTVKVLSADRIRVYLRGGMEIEQTIEGWQ